jgi:predicted transcriptional regulator
MVCLKALWALGQGTVADVRGALPESKPLAYTTVMTILERLARRNIVERAKNGRAFLYVPRISRDSMRRLALKEFVDCYFEGSEERLADFLHGSGAAPEPVVEIEIVSDGLDAALL